MKGVVPISPSNILEFPLKFVWFDVFLFFCWLDFPFIQTILVLLQKPFFERRNLDGGYNPREVQKPNIFILTLLSVVLETSC